MSNSEYTADESSSVRDIRTVLWHALPIQYQRLIDGVPHVMILRNRGHVCVPVSELTAAEVRRLGRACGLFSCKKSDRVRSIIP